MTVQQIKFNSKQYEAMIQLRITQLLQPIGVPASYIVPENEQKDFFIAAFEKDDIVGCCVLTPKNNDVIQLRQMAVRNDFRKKGIGAAMIQFAEKTAKEKGFFILMMHARNTVIEFYKKSGYQITGEEFFEVGIKHHKMKKTI